MRLLQPGVLYGESGNDILKGSGGNDILYGGGDDDILDGGAGDDLLVGGHGHDVFVFGKGYGHDRVDASDNTSSPKDEKVKLVGLNSNDVEFGIASRTEGTTTYQDFVIRIKETGETMTVLDGASRFKFRQIQNVEFDDGTIWSWADILQAGLHATAADESLRLFQSGVLYGEDGNDTLTGSIENDVLYGGAGDDTLSGGLGNDILDGGAGDDLLVGGGNGNDVFVFGKGYGHDRVDASDNTSSSKDDKVKLVGLNLDDVEFSIASRTEGTTTYQDFVIRIKETGETMTVLDGASRFKFRQIQNVEFDDGTIWSWADILQAGLHATAADESLTLFQSGVLYGEGGNDKLNGSISNDALYGGAGDDTLSGGIGDDILDGGTGNDLLVGGNGNDVYVFGKGYGHDRVDAYFCSSSSNNDKVKLVGLNPDDVEFGASTRVDEKTTCYDFVIRIKETGETLTVLNGAFRSAFGQIKSVEFENGTVWSWEQVLQAGLHGTAADESLTLFQSGVLYGGAGDDTLSGCLGDDILDGGAGNDLLIGGKGNDVFVFGKGYGHDRVDAYQSPASRQDIIRLVELNPDDVEFAIASRTEGTTTYQDFVIRIKETGETMTVLDGASRFKYYQIQNVEFGDGTIWSWDDVKQFGINGTYGTQESGTLQLNQAGAFYGNSGNDTLIGNSGNDILSDGSGEEDFVGFFATLDQTPALTAEDFIVGVAYQADGFF